jgi:hypothetical protein
MEAKTSKVKSVSANGTYEGQHGLLYKFNYVMEDGAELAANHKSQTPFPEGADIEYVIKGTNEYGSWGAVSKPKDGGYQAGGYNKSKGNQTASFALSYAKDLAIGGIIKEEQILLCATKFNTWLKENS